MQINATEQTSTFPCPLDKLKGRLMDNLNLVWQTPHGEFEITKENIPWIMQNARTSMYNDNRSYIYNKAFYEAFFNPKHTPEPYPLPSRFDLIRTWASDRGIYDQGNSHTQYVKLQEEAGELAKALLEENMLEIVDAIGDIVVVLTNLAELNGVRIEDCIDVAYKEIANRKGKMENGTFVKETL
jgi:NTP pyrophosphatase (non-canonical NTP hydrolase)